MNNVNELITLCLTLAFPAYLLKISRSFEVILLEEKIKNSKIKICDKDRIEREILVKKNLIDELLFPNRVYLEITSLLCNECHSDYSCLDYNDNDI